MESNNTNHRSIMLADTAGKVIKKRYSKDETVKILERLALANLKKRYPNNPYLPTAKYRDDTSNGLMKCCCDYISLSGLKPKLNKSKGFLKDNRKVSIDVLGHKRTIGSVQFVNNKPKDKFYNFSTIIKGQNIKILIKSSPTVSKKQDNGSVGSVKQIECAESIFLIVENFSQFFEWLNKFTKD